MKKESLLKIEREAEKVLKNLPGDTCPTPIEAIIKSFDIMVGHAGSDEYSGILIRKSDKKVLMGLNSSEPYHRQRFTMAHELGHFILHQTKTAFVDKKISVDYRGNHSYSNSVREAQANIFAAALLMPRQRIIDDFNQIITSKKIFLEDQLIELASKYYVSKDAMKYRLMNLELI
jgi:Zn-dependent peptidase ImmA (M78 family)